MAKLKLALIFGGKSGEHEVSITSALSIYNALDKTKYDVTFVGIDKAGRWLLPHEAKLLANTSNPRLVRLNEIQKESVGLLPYEAEKNLVSFSNPSATSTVDVVFPVLHGTFGEDGTIQGLLELANVAYVGAGVLGSSLAMDKEVAKRVMRDAGIPVVPFFCVRRHEFEKNPKTFLEEAKKKLGFPYFVKPANMGSSVGVNKIKNEAEALAKFKDAFLYDTKILVEKGIDARELECSVLGSHDPKASIIGEIIPTHEFYSYEAKYIDENGAELKIPATGLDTATVKKIQDLAVRTFQALECHGMARVDFFMDKKSGEVYLNEINTIPGFTKISMYPKLWEASGIPYPKLLDRLIELALERHREKNNLKTTYEPKGE